MSGKVVVSPSDGTETSDPFLPPSVPQSSASVEENDDVESRMTDDIVFKGKTPTRDTFRPNPKAPIWAPSVTSDGKKTEATPSRSAKKASGGVPLHRLPDEIESAHSGSSKASPAPTGNTERAEIVSPFPAAKQKTQPFFPGPAHEASNTAGGDNSNATYSGIVTKRPETGDPNRPEDWTAEDVRAAMSHLYEMARGVIVNKFRPGETNVPDEMLSTQEPNTWAYLNNLIYPGKPESAAHLKYLLSIMAYRPYVMERVLLDYTFKKMMSPGIFLGFTGEMDKHLAALQEQILNYTGKLKRTPSFIF